jgi:VanZ family protein
MSLLEIHVALSLIEMPVGFAVIYGLLHGRAYGGWTALFLVLAVLTSLTGFPLAPFGFDPPRAVGVLSLVLLAIAIVALYAFGLRGAWRWIYAVTAIAALYLDVFVGVFQAFLKVPSVHDLAPTQSEPPFAIAQGVVLLIFVGLGIFTVRRFHPATT